MKRIAFILAVLMCFGMPITAFAQNDIEANATDAPREVAVVEENTEPIENIQHDIPRLADGEAGRGEIESPEKYWEANGYPDNISFAFEAGGETLDDGTIIAYYEIGIVNSDEIVKQEILDMVSPNCRITFRDCTYSYSQREAAFNEIYASRDDIVLDVVMLRNSQNVLVAIADGYEKEYAQKYIEQYGAFVSVTNDITAANDAMSGIGGMDKGNSAKSGFDFWLWSMLAALLIGIVAIAYFKRARLIPAMQPNNGNVVTGNTPVSRKQTIAAIKSNAVKPSDDVFASIMDRVGKAKKL